jgi:hypothetical protein
VKRISHDEVASNWLRRRAELVERAGRKSQ